MLVKVCRLLPRDPWPVAKRLVPDNSSLSWEPSTIKLNNPTSNPTAHRPLPTAHCPLLSRRLQNLSRSINRGDHPGQTILEIRRIVIVDGLAKVSEWLRRVTGEGSRSVNLVLVPRPAD